MNKCWDVLASLCEGGGQGNVPYTISVCLDTDSTMPISPSSINKLVPPDEKNGRLMPVFGIVFVTTAMFRIACSVWLTIVLSFAFYIPVVLWADVIPMIGMLMIPKTCAYVWTVLIGYKAMKKEIA